MAVPRRGGLVVLTSVASWAWHCLRYWMALLTSAWKLALSLLSRWPYLSF